MNSGVNGLTMSVCSFRVIYCTIHPECVAF